MTEKQQLQRLQWNPVNTATNGPWKSIHIGGSNIIDLYFTLMLFYSTNERSPTKQKKKTSKLTNKRLP